MKNQFLSDFLLFGNHASLKFTNLDALSKSIKQPLAYVEPPENDEFTYEYSEIKVNDVTFTAERLSPVKVMTRVTSYSLLVAFDGYYEIIDGDTRIVSSPSKALLIPPTKTIHLTSTPDQVTNGFLISFDLARLQKMAQQICGSEVNSLTTRTVNLILNGVDFKRALIGLSAQIDAFEGQEELLISQGLDNQVYSLLTLLLHDNCINTLIAEREAQQLDKKGLEFISAFSDYIQKNLKKPINVDHISSHLGLSGRALRYHCEKYFHCSPREYWLNEKLKYAHNLIKDKNFHATLAQLSENLGFSSQSRFTAFFKQKYGVAPSTLKKEIKK